MCACLGSRGGVCWGVAGGGGDCLELPALGSVAKRFLQSTLVTVLFSDDNSCRWRGMAASHVASVESISMWRLSCCWNCLQWFMQFCLWLCIVLWNGNGALAELHPLTRCMRWAGDCGRRKTATKARIYDSNRHFFLACWLHQCVHINSSRSLTTVLLKYSVSALYNTYTLSLMYIEIRMEKV